MGGMGGMGGMSGMGGMGGTGRLFVFEGIDGSGKSVQAAALAARLRQAGHDVLETREPTDGLHAREIGHLLRHGREGVSCRRETLLFTEDRRQHVREAIRPALDAGRMVVCDRYYFSTMAYQGAAGDEVERIRRLNEAFAPKPDRVYLMDLPVAEALARIQSSDRESVSAFENAAYLERVRALFLGFPDPFILRLDSVAPVHDVSERIAADALRLIGGPCDGG